MQSDGGGGVSVTKQFSTFYLQNLMFGVESQNIQEVRSAWSGPSVFSRIARARL